MFFNQITVGFAGNDEFFVGTDGFHFTLLQHHDLIGVADEIQFMGNSYDGFACKVFKEGIADGGGGFSIQCAGRFVQLL